MKHVLAVAIFVLLRAPVSALDKTAFVQKAEDERAAARTPV
jgi:hypothetical protein